MGNFVYTKKLATIIEVLFLVIFAYGFVIDTSILNEVPNPIDLETAYLYFFAIVGFIVLLARFFVFLSNKIERNPETLKSLSDQGYYLLNLTRAGAHCVFFLYIAIAFVSISDWYNFSANLHEVMVLLFSAAAILYPIYKGLDVAEDPNPKDIFLFFVPLLLVGLGQL